MMRPSLVLVFAAVERPQPRGSVGLGPHGGQQPPGGLLPTLPSLDAIESCDNSVFLDIHWSLAGLCSGSAVNKQAEHGYSGSTGCYTCNSNKVLYDIIFLVRIGNSASRPIESAQLQPPALQKEDVVSALRFCTAK